MSIRVPNYGRDFSRQMRKARKELVAIPDAVNKPFFFWLTLPPSVNAAYYTRKATAIGQAPGRGLTAAAKAWKKEARDIAEMEALRVGWKLTRHSKIVVELVAYWPDASHSHDIHNLHKLLADALEKAIYDNDRMALLRDMDFHVDERRPRVELKIWQMEG